MLERQVEELNLQLLEQKKIAGEGRIRLLDCAKKMGEMTDELVAARAEIERLKTDTVSNTEVREWIKNFGKAVRNSHSGWWEAYCNSFERQAAEWGLKFEHEDGEHQERYDDED